MPVRYATDNEHKLFILHFSGYVAEPDLHNAIAGMFRDATDGTYRNLLIFEQGIDLSAFDVMVLRNARHAANEAFARSGIVRGKSAAAVDAAVDAHMVMRLWNALCDADADDHRFALFRELEAALEYLDAPPDIAGRMAALTQARC